ncbi:MAG TPA: hypothetical protein VHS06_06330 [Chloroflexota bacterium]|nr:hypothetical protein [Chloroflexota bacterium]
MAIDRGSKVTFYRCRLCGESHGMVDVREVLCVLDYRMTEKQEMVDGSLRINWHKHGGMFDFDRIEIIRATDEDVMRLAMDAGNDIDPHRFPHYAGMPCYIDPECSLSENVRRILQDRFGKSC